MEQLKYREILNQQFKSYIGKPVKFKEYKIDENKLYLNFTNRMITLNFYEDGIVKVFISDIYEEAKPTGAVCYNNIYKDISVNLEDDNIIIKCEEGYICVDKYTTEITFLDLDKNIICRDFQPSFVDENGHIFITKENDAIAYYGFGEKGGELNKKGCYMENYNTDDPETDDNSVIYYKTIPFYVAAKKNHTYGIFFDNSFRSYFDMGKSYKDRIFFGANGGQIQYYFIFGKNIKDVVRRYTLLTGRMDMPPLWSLGYQQCRFSYFSKQEVEELLDTFEQKDIPIDVVYLDIDYMDGFRVMTFKSPEFDGIGEAIHNFKEKGIKTITILDPGVKVDENYSVYNRGLAGDYFTKTLDGKVFIGAVWPNDSAFPDFSNEQCRKWWKEELKQFITKYNIDGIWNDMNEPCVFNNEYKTMLENCLHNSDYGIIEHKEFHNRYGFEMSRASCEAQQELYPNKRGFSMTRATYAGGQRYSSVWTGDNMSLWQQLRMSITMNCNLGISGFAFVGNDVSGFGLDSTEELFIRWNQLGTFLPILRNHSNMYTRRQEPWAFGKRAEDIAKRCIKLRYELMPYIYNLYYQAHKLGFPIFRPMVMEFQDDINVLDLKEQFMFGNAMLVAPVVYEGERKKVVYLPKGNWYNYFTNEKFEGGKTYNLQCELDEVLVFVKEGSIIPVYEQEYKNTKNRPNEVTFKIYGDNAKTLYYYDDGETNDYLQDKYNLCEVTFENNNYNVNYVVKSISEEKFNFKKDNNML